MRIAGWIPRASSRSSSRPSASSSLACASSSAAASGSAGQLRLGEAKAESERDEALLCTIVKVPLEPLPLGVAGLDDARARRGQLLAGLRVCERDGDEVREFLEASLDVGWESLGLVEGDRGGAPESPGDNDRSRHSRAHARRDHVLLDVGRLVLQVDPRGSTGMRDARDRTALKRQAYAERGVEPSVPHPDRPRSLASSASST